MKYFILLIFILTKLSATEYEITQKTPVSIVINFPSSDTNQYILSINEARFKSKSPNSINYIPQNDIACVKDSAMIDAFNTIVHIGKLSRHEISGMKPGRAYIINIYDFNYNKIDSIQFKTLSLKHNLHTN